MFKKLRNKFLWLNMVMISILLIASFFVVFMVTYNNLSRTINNELNHSLGIFQNKNMNDKNFIPNNNGFRNPNNIFDRNRNDNNLDYEPGGEKTNSEPAKPTDLYNIPPAPNEPITILVKNDKSIIQKRSPYDYDDDFYNEVINKAINNINEKIENNDSISKSEDIIKYNDVYWKYMVKVVSPTNLIGAETVYSISMLNVNTQLNFLQKLIFILFFVLIFALIIVFLICLYFANKSIKPIELAWDKQTQFIADASHELKTPLTTINANVDVLLAHSDNTISDEKKWLIYIQDEAKRMAKLTDTLLYLTKVDYSSSDNTMFSNFSLSSAVENILLTLEAVIYEKKFDLSETILDDVNISGDEDRIKQLILILLDNAIKYTSQGGTIEVKLVRNEKNAEFSVMNTGEGIPPEDIERVFDRFYRFDKSRSRNSGGYGLGLAIAKSIVTLHKGTIKVKSENGEYTKFTIYLPLA